MSDLPISSREITRKNSPIDPKSKASRTRGKPAPTSLEPENAKRSTKTGLRKYSGRAAKTEKAKMRKKYLKAPESALDIPGIPERLRAMTRKTVFIALDSERARAMPLPRKGPTKAKAKTILTPKEKRPAQVGVFASERA